MALMNARMILSGTLTMLTSIALAQTAPIEAKGQHSPAASIRGWAVHPDGTPLWTVEIEPVKQGGARAVVLVSQKDGSFESEPLPPGRYRLGVCLGLNRQPNQAYPRTYYPRTQSRDQALEIEIVESESPHPIMFSGPPMRPQVTVRGTVVYADGKPAVGVDVFLSQIDDNHSTAQVWSDPKGGFEFGTYGAVDHEILSKSRDENFEATKQLIRAADLDKPVRLVLIQK
jgi:hypothetical protein